MTATAVVRARQGSSGTRDRPPVLTAAVVAATLILSVAALRRPGLMQLLVRDLPGLRAGQWWRLVTPVFVQSSGWGQLGFNMAELAVVGTAVERSASRAVWVLVFVLGGVGSVAVLSALRPAGGGGGTSDAVAALIGALAVVRAFPGLPGAATVTGARVWPSQVFSVFFVGYLTMLDVAGVWPATLAGDASVALFVVARRTWPPSVVDHVVLAAVGVGGLVMAGAEDGHGVGILAGFLVAALLLARQARLAGPIRSATRRRIVTAVVGTVALGVATWVAWVRLVGVPLAVRGGGPALSVVGWPEVAAAAGLSCLAAALAQQVIRRRRVPHAARTWSALCVGVALASTAGPLTLAAGSSCRAGLVSLHLVCAAAVIALLAPQATGSHRDDPTARARPRRRPGPG